MRIAVVDDHPIVWEGIRSVLEPEQDMEIVGCAGNSRDAGNLFAREQPDIALVDLRLAGESGMDLVRKMKPLMPECRFVILTTFGLPEDVQLALDIGVDGYILKEALPDEMVSAMRLIWRGRSYFDPTVTQSLVKAKHKVKELFGDLTEREMEVLQALAMGMNNREIASMLYVSEHTVKKHISGILAKLELKDRTQAAVYALAHGIGRDKTKGEQAQ